MRKSLLAAVLTMSTATFAQVPDASTWTKGMDISKQIAWGNLSFENDPMDFWKFDKAEGGSTTTTGGLFEVYDGEKCDLYQYVQLPKGQYRLECQAYYRFGTSWDEDPKAMSDGSFENNAILYVQNGTYDIDSEEFTKGANRFENPVMPRLYNDASYKLYDDPDYTVNADGSKSYTAGWDRSDGEYQVSGSTVYGPCSVPGSLVWFQNGYYAATEPDAEEPYNVVEFFVKEDGWVRLGISKEAKKGADSFMATNFKMFYTGEITVNAELEAKQKQVALAFAKIAGLENTYEGKLGGLVSDYVIDNYNDGTSCETIEACDEAIAQLNGVYSQIMEAKTYADNIPGLVKSANVLLSKTDYAGKAAFGEFVAKGYKFFGEDSEVEDGDDFSVFKKYYDELSKARLDYLMTQEAVNGIYDFSSAINYPFFCNNEYTPVWDEAAHCYVYQDVTLDEDEVDEDGNPILDEAGNPVKKVFNLETTWGEVQEKDYKAVKDENPSWVKICEDVTIYEKEVENQWVLHATTWHGSGVNSITMQHSYPAVGGWTGSPSGNPEFLHQTITGLPNGCYAMSAMMLDASGEVPSTNMYAYIENSQGDREIALHTKAGKTFWWGGRDNWRRYIIDPNADAGCWDEMKTAIISVTDGKVTIGTASDSFYAATGFRLYYYGETPDYQSLLAEARLSVEKGVSELALKGDSVAVAEILSSIPEIIETPAQYYKASDILKEAQAYINEANRATNDFESFISDLTPMCAGEPCYDPILDAALDASDREKDGVSYKGMEPVKKVFNAVKSYLAEVEKYEDYANEEGVKAVIEENAAYLSKNYPTIEKVEELKGSLSYQVHKIVFASNGASAATEAKPADITNLIKNADFSDGRNGWIGDPTVDGNFENAEFYNTTFNLNQVIYGLPAGCYKVQVQAFYRDGSDYKASYTNWNVTAAQDPELWENNNVLLYANNATSYVTSIASELYTERGMVRKFKDWEGSGEDRTPIYVEWDDLPEGENVNGHPWDANVDVESYDDDGETVTTKYYFAQSMEGAHDRFVLSPDAFINEVYVMVEEGGNLSLGLVKENKIGNDWCIFDNFKLFYLGTATPTGVASVNSANAGAKMFFNAAGIRTNGMNKGINIVKMADGSVKKVVK